MELIKYIGRKFINNCWATYGIFWCSFCKQEVEKQLGNGKIAKSCGCKWVEFQIESHKGQKAWNKGLTKDTDKRIKDISEKNLGTKRTSETKNKQSNKKKGKKLSEKTKLKMREAHKEEKHWNWQGGKSFEPYSPEFNKDLKSRILIKDNYKCQNIHCSGKSSNLRIHHIDYNKKNNSEGNLITLCNSCHIKTNRNRSFWENYYKNKNKLLYQKNIIITGGMGLLGGEFSKCLSQNGGNIFVLDLFNKIKTHNGRRKNNLVIYDFT